MRRRRRRKREKKRRVQEMEGGERREDKRFTKPKRLWTTAKVLVKFTSHKSKEMGSLPAVLLLCSFHALTAVVQAQTRESAEQPGATPLPANCRGEMYPCTRMYSVQRPVKRCIGRLCLYSLPRVYVINNEICTRTVCQQDEYLRAELCRELSGWPRRLERSTTRKRCRNRSGNIKTWANQA
ncbi:microfibril associated protein 5 [Nothobranchius furzeri]|nr:microfibril associated protein 5 [Nothobranchius furzeri]